jgi:hypothetical protein
MTVEIDDAIAIAEHEWRLSKVDPRDIAALSRDLRLDLAAAAADGVTPQQLVGDVRTFARRVAEEADARHVPYEYQRLLLTALAGTLPGLVVGKVAMSVVPELFDGPLTGWHAALVYYGAGAAGVLLGSLLTVAVLMRDVAEIRRTVRAMAVLVPLAGLAVTPVAMGFAALTGYSLALPIIATELALVAGALAGAIVLARRWALRGRYGRAAQTAALAPAG